MTDQLMRNWRLPGAIDYKLTQEMLKVAFQAIEEYISDLLRQGIPLEKELPPLVMQTNNSPAACPYNLSNIEYPGKKAFTVDFDEQVNPSLKACIEDFAQYIQSDKRMSFWQSPRGGQPKWISKPESHAKDLLHTFLVGRFPKSLIFEEITSGAGRIDIFIVSPTRERAVVELKMCGVGYSMDYAQDGGEQLTHYMNNKAANFGYLVVFDARSRDFGKGFGQNQSIDRMSVTTIVADLRPYVKRRDMPEDL